MDRIKYHSAIIVLLSLIVSCSPKNYPAGKPFVFHSSVSLKVDMPKEQRSATEAELYNYLDDSLKVRTKSILGFQKVIDPPVFDSNNIDRSKAFIKNYLNSLGYYRATFDTFTVRYDRSVKDQNRVWFNLKVNAGKQLRFDSIWYEMNDPEMDSLAKLAAATTLIKKGDGYSKQIVGQELDRLASFYRNNGYFRMNRGGLQAEADTVDKALISLENDAFDQLQLIGKRRENPTTTLRIFKRPGTDTSVFLKYRLGDLYIYPETKIDDDPEKMMADSTYQIFEKDHVTLRYRNGDFRNRTVMQFNRLRPGSFYDEGLYFKTFNAYTQAGSWQQVDVKAKTYRDPKDSAEKVDLHFFLSPAKKFSAKVDLEGSQNIGRNSLDVLTGSFFGISVVGNLLNRNFARSAIQWNNSIRTGAEINSGSSGTGLFQSLLLSAGTTFSIPRLWPPFNTLIKKAEVSRTFLNLNGSYNNRRNLYDLRNLNMSFGFEWKKKNNVWTIKMLNVEFVDLFPTDSLRKLVADNPQLNYQFNQGLVLGVAVTFQREFRYANKPNQNSYLRVSLEESGGLTGNFLFTSTIKRFIKADLEFRHNITFPKSKWAFRFAAGYGMGLTNAERSLPIYRQFICGGPLSMRAWKLRQLGFGNSLRIDTVKSAGSASRSDFRDRLGDVYLEMNGEYRFPMFKWFGFPFEGAFFADAGNIWLRKGAGATSDDQNFRLKHLYRDLAVAGGFGVRIDFTYLRLRLDYAYKLKDPVRAGDGWMKKFEFKSPNRAGNYENSNVALQFGIDYPF